MHNTIGSRLRVWKESKGFEQEAAAAHLGMSASTYQNYERDVRRPRADAMEKFARGGINTNWLLTGEGPMLLQDRPYPAAENDSACPATPLIARLSAEEPGITAAAATLDEEQYAAWAAKIPVENFVPVRYCRREGIPAGHGALSEDCMPDALLFPREFLHRAGAHPGQLLLMRVRDDSMAPTLHHGWTVMIDTARRHVNSALYAIQAGGQETVKRLESRPGGMIRVISDNKRYGEYEVSRTGDDFTVIGEVIWIAGLVR